MIKKNDLVNVTIEDMTEDGDGIGKALGFTLFIKDVVVGDVVEAKIMKMKKRYGFARVMSIIVPSKERGEPLCECAKACGGCQLQSMNYDATLRFKQNKVQNHLQRIGGISLEVSPTLGMENPTRFRNKAQLPVRLSKNGDIQIGFYARHSHYIVEHDDCIIGSKDNAIIIDAIKSFMNIHHIMPYDEETYAGEIRHLYIRESFHHKGIMVCLVINGTTFRYEKELVEALRALPLPIESICLNWHPETTNVILGKEIKVLYGDGYVLDAIKDLTYQISPLSFFQVNPRQTEVLYQTALDFANLQGNEIVWDLYCGIGTISLFLAKSARKVFGVEIIPQAIKDAKKNAKLNAIENAEFFVGKAEEVLPKHYEKTKEKADVIVVDPPRKGCEQVLLDTIVNMEPEKVVYVSCDSATLARDLKYMCEKGYEVIKVQPVDLFGWSGHVETVCLLSKLNAEHHIEVNLELDELDLTSSESKATYEEIKDYVLKTTGLKVSSLYISQVKRKLGIEVGECYNLPKSENAHVPQCPVEKETAIVAALRHFEMI